MKTYFVYILANRKEGTIYVGITSDIIRRVYEHKTKSDDGFTSEYNVDRLVYFEQFFDVLEAIAREKRLKRWRRNWKIELIESGNPEWRDLYDDLLR